MKILEANAGALTNFEVLDFLRAKGASKDPTRVIAKVSQSEYKVYDYLSDTAAGSQTKENINEFLESVKQHDLAKAEILNIINIRAARDVEIYPIIECFDQRFTDEELAEIAEMVEKTLPPLPDKNKPEEEGTNGTPEEEEEETNGTKETATLTHENGNETSEDQNGGGEQMETG